MSEARSYRPAIRPSIRPPMRSGTMFPKESGLLSENESETPASSHFLGRYRVVEEIGAGGMASVHLARMDGPGGFQKWAAIKKVHAHLIDDASVVQMFLDEARIAARISHPNVATVFDLDQHDGSYCIAMEYLHGEPLREVMRRTEEAGTVIPPEITCRIIADAAEGLHAAHELVGNSGEKLNLVHRDASPHNIFVTYEGVTKVVDFGIAKFSSRANHTRAGILKGKVAYMSPEQARSEPVDRRTDIFALGVILWELTTGRRLFWMESDIDMFSKVEECVIPRPSEIVHGYPLDLETIVLKALARNRADRFRSARELSRALQSLLMRRDLFVSSDEVAVYMRETFADRIRERDARLRAAADASPTGALRRTTPPVPAPRPSAPEISDTIPADALPLPPRSASDVHGMASENRPTVAPARARRSLWMVALLSSFLALFIVGLVLSVLAMAHLRTKRSSTRAELGAVAVSVTRNEPVGGSSRHDDPEGAPVTRR